jgi:hypothetical protein
MSLPVAIEIYVKCNGVGCDYDLESQFIHDTLFVDPCPECEKKAMITGYKDGMKDA